MSAVTLIPLILSSITELSKLFHSTVKTARKNAELTPEQEADWQAKWDATRKGPEWMPSTDPQSQPVHDTSKGQPGNWVWQPSTESPSVTDAQTTTQNDR